MFHIQTEDSGIRHPHIITHLFADGGRILKTAKTSYAEFIDAANMGEVVRQMMQDQHKAMFMALRDGQFDHLVDDLPPVRGVAKVPAAQPPAAPPSAAAQPPAAAPTTTVPAAPSVAAPLAVVAPAAVATAITADVQAAPAPKPADEPAPAPPPATPIAPPATPIAPPSAPTAAAAQSALLRPLGSAPTQPAVHIVLPPAPPISSVNVVTAPPGPAATRPPVTQPSPVLRPTPSRVPSARPRLDIDPAAIHRAPAPGGDAASGTLASVVEATVEATPGIDLDTLERAAAEAETPLFQQIRDLPPPPAAVLGPRVAAGGSGGGYSSISAPGPVPPPPPSTRGRYAPSRPSSIFASVRPHEGASIFGEDLISEKSLDEVILSYLAEDLDGPGEKK